MLTFIHLCQQEHNLSSNREQTVSTVFPRFVIVFAVIQVFRLNLSIRDLEALGGFNHFIPITEVQPTRVWDLSIPGSVQLPSPTFCFIHVTTKYWFDDFSSADSRSSRRRRRHDCWTLHDFRCHFFAGADVAPPDGGPGSRQDTSSYAHQPHKCSDAPTWNIRKKCCKSCKRLSFEANIFVPSEM